MFGHLVYLHYTTALICNHFNGICSLVRGLDFSARKLPCILNYSRESCVCHRTINPKNPSDGTMTVNGVSNSYNCSVETLQHDGNTILALKTAMFCPWEN